MSPVSILAIAFAAGVCIAAAYAFGYLCGHADARKREPRP